MPAAIPLIAGGAVLGGAGAIYGGYKQKQALDYNAKLANQAAEQAKVKAAYDEAAHRENVAKFISSQKADYGKSGVEMSGSPLLVINDTIAKSELDALAIRYGGEIESAQLRSKGAGLRAEGQTARTMGFLGGGSSLLTGAGNIAMAKR